MAHLTYAVMWRLMTIAKSCDILTTQGACSVCNVLNNTVFLCRTYYKTYSPREQKC